MSTSNEESVPLTRSQTAAAQREQAIDTRFENIEKQMEQIQASLRALTEKLQPVVQLEENVNRQLQPGEQVKENVCSDSFSEKDVLKIKPTRKLNRSCDNFPHIERELTQILSLKGYQNPEDLLNNTTTPTTRCNAFIIAFLEGAIQDNSMLDIMAPHFRKGNGINAWRQLRNEYRSREKNRSQILFEELRKLCYSGGNFNRFCQRYRSIYNSLSELGILSWSKDHFMDFKRSLASYEKSSTYMPILELHWNMASPNSLDEVINIACEKFLTIYPTGCIIKNEGKAMSSRDGRKQNLIYDCKFCGKNHKRKECSAYQHRCQVCKRKGHLEALCYTRKNQAEQTKQSVDQLCPALEEFARLSIDHTFYSGEDVVCIDSGASSGGTAVEENLTNFRADNSYTISASGERILSNGTGTFKLPIQDMSVELKHQPNLTQTLVSMVKLQKAGATFIGVPDPNEPQMFLIKNRKAYKLINMNDTWNLSLKDAKSYTIDYVLSLLEAKKEFTNSSNDPIATSTHRNLLHASAESIKHVYNVATLKTSECDICRIAKAHHGSTAQGNYIYDTNEEALQKSLSVDFKEMESFDVITIVNGTSRICQYYQVAEKSEAEAIYYVKKFINLWGSNKLMYVTVDAAKTFLGHEFKKAMERLHLRVADIPQCHHHLLLAETYNKRFANFYRIIETENQIPGHTRHIINFINERSLHIPVKTKQGYIVPFKENFGKLMDVTKFKFFGDQALIKNVSKISNEKPKASWMVYLGPSCPEGNVYDVGLFIPPDKLGDWRYIKRHAMVDCAQWRPFHTDVTQFSIDSAETLLEHAVASGYLHKQAPPTSESDHRKLQDWELRNGNDLNKASPDAKYKFYEPIRKELQTILDHKVIRFKEATSKEDYKGCIGSMFVLNVKRDGTHKARLVAYGNQVPDMAKEDKYSPTANDLSIKSIIYYALIHDIQLHGADFSAAYLNGTIQNPVNIILPFPLAIKGKKILGQIIGNLYGLQPAGKIWNEKLTKVGRDLGFKPTEIDPCLWIHTQKKIALVIHVDDMLIASSNDDFQWLLKAFAEKTLKINETSLDDFLGMEVIKTSSGYFLSQTAYVNNILDKFGYTLQSKPSQTPMTEGTKIYPTFEKQVEPTKYRSMLNSASYLRKTRYDILFCLKELARVQNSPTEAAHAQLDKLFRYLRCSKHFGLHLQKPTAPITLTVYSDASFAACPSTRKSCGGQLVMVNNSPLAADSKDQTIVTDSTTYAETYELTRSTKLLVTITNLWKCLGLDRYLSKDLIPIYVDNTATIDLSFRTGMSKRSRHFEIKCWYFKQYLNKLFRLKYIETKENLADIFTKALGAGQFKYLRNQFMLSRKDL